MPLRIELEPNEQLLVNGVALRVGANGGKAVEILVESEARVLRGRAVIRGAEADTPAKRLCVTLQALYLSDPRDRMPFEDAFAVQGRELIEAAPSTGPFVLAISEMLAANQHHRALRHARGLVEYEAGLLAMAKAALAGDDEGEGGAVAAA